MEPQLYHVLTQICETCLHSKSDAPCAREGCVYYARVRVAQPLANVVRLLGGSVRKIPSRVDIEAQMDREVGPGLRMLLELHQGERSIRQLAAAVYGADTSETCSKTSQCLKHYRGYIEQVRLGVWKLVSVPPALERYLANSQRAEAAE